MSHARSRYSCSLAMQCSHAAIALFWLIDVTAGAGTEGIALV